MRARTIALTLIAVVTMAGAVTAAPPVITSWESVLNTPQGEGAIALDPSKGNGDIGANGPTVECRRGGVEAIRITFDVQVEPVDLTLDANDVTVTDGDSNTYSPSSITLDGGAVGTVLTITFSPKLAEGARYTIDVTGKFRATSDASVATGDQNCQVRTLAGDASGDAAVTLGDVVAVRNHNRETLSPSNARYDITGDGKINLIDAAFVKSHNGDSLPES